MESFRGVPIRAEFSLWRFVRLAELSQYSYEYLARADFDAAELRRGLHSGGFRTLVSSGKQRSQFRAALAAGGTGLRHGGRRAGCADAQPVSP